MPDRELTLVIPGLLGPWPTAMPMAQLPALEKLLSRARKNAHAESPHKENYETAVCTLFGLPSTSELPLAALTQLIDYGQQQSGYWLRADPVHLHADMYRLLLQPAPPFSLSEAEDIATSFNSSFSADGFSLETPQPSRWYLRCHAPHELRTTPLSVAFGLDISALLPSGPTAPRWHSLLTEFQMFLHNHPLNLARESRSQITVNSLWLYGGGGLPTTAPTVSFEDIFGNDILIRALARWAGHAFNPLPDTAQECLALSGGRILVVLTDLLTTVQTQDQQHWHEVLQNLERDWFSLLLVALQQKQLSALKIIPCNGQQFTINRTDLRYFWRKSHALSDWL